MKRRVLATAALAALCGAPLRAEVIEASGEFAAPHREASLLASLAVERIGGTDGAALAIAIERALERAPFELLGGRAGRERAEGALSGTVTTGVDERGYRQKRKKCVERDDKDKCVKEAEVEVPCRRRIVNVNADLRIVRNTDGRILYSEAHPVREEVTWCEGETPRRTAEDAVAQAIVDIAAGVRDDIVPRIETYRIRVRESTKGMAKPDAAAFRALVKQSARDPAGACAGWDAMRGVAGGHPSLLFDLGACAEMRGDYAQAGALYGQAVVAGAGEGREAQGRIAQLIAGREDAAERARRRRD